MYEVTHGNPMFASDPGARVKRIVLIKLATDKSD